MATKTKIGPKQEQTFETASAELNAILEELLREETTLNRTLELYARSAELVAFCSGVLQQATMTIEEIDAKLATAQAAQNSSERES